MRCARLQKNQPKGRNRRVKMTGYNKNPLDTPQEGNLMMKWLYKLEYKHPNW